MKLSAILLLAFCLQVSARGISQNITLSVKNEKLEKVLSLIEAQAGVNFIYDKLLLDKAINVTLNVDKQPLNDVLAIVFRDQPLAYKLSDNYIVLSLKSVAPGLNPGSTSPAHLQPPPITVRGKITDPDGKPLAGATVQVKGNNQRTQTDSEGVFSLVDVDEKATLIVTFIGYASREFKAAEDLTISLTPEIQELDEQVVVAYNTTTQRANTGAVTVLKGEQIQTLPNRSFDKSLQGLVPGLLVTSGNGQPGGGLSNFVLRGIATGTDATFGSTVRNPLIILDGVPVYQDHIQMQINSVSTPVSNPMAQLNPSDIESITVLKDASAIALYGSRASNGVIILTTKRGAAGKARIVFRHQTDIASRFKKDVDVLNQQEYLELLFEDYRNYDPATYPDDISVLEHLKTLFPKNANGDFYPVQSWSNELYRNNAVSVSNDLALSGGSDKNAYYLNLEYTKQNGVIKETGFDRKSLRFNFDSRPMRWLKYSLNSALSYSEQDLNAAAEFSPVGTPMFVSPLNPIRDENGNYILNYSWGMAPFAFIGDSAANPVAQASYNINRNTSYRGLTRASLELLINKNLTFSSNVGVDFMLTESKEKIDPRLWDDQVYASGVGRIQERDLRRAHIITTNLLRYGWTVAKYHNFHALAGQEAQILTQKSQTIGVQNLELNYYDQINSPGVVISTYSGGVTKETLHSLFGQLNYDFRSKYYFSSSLRRDGSSRFGDNKKYGTYWSTGVGWVLSSESFIGQRSPFSYLKLRGSVGVAGSSAAISQRTRYDLLSIRTLMGNTVVIPSSPGNPEIQWEKTFTWDVGMEGRLWKDRISFTIDYYRRNTSNLVYNIILAPSSGYNSIQDNIGKIENTGLEISAAMYIIHSSVFKWHLNANWSTNRNVLIKADVPLAAVAGSTLGNEEGRNFNSFYLPKWAGVNALDGLPIWIDSTGKPSSDFGAARKYFVGKPQPDAFGAVTNTFSFNNFDLTFLLYYQYGFQIYDNNTLVSDGSFPYMNQSKAALNRWQHPGDVAQNPRRMLYNFDGGIEPSTRYLYDGDYIRLKNVVLAYTFENKSIRALGINAIKMFVQGNNLALWSTFKHQDPDVSNAQGSSNFAYPNQRTFSFGLNINL